MSSAVICGGVLFYAIENTLGEWGWQRYRQSLISQGQRFDPAAFNQPPIPDEENFLEAPLVRDWFALYRTPPAGTAAQRIITITPPSDADLLGGWNVSRPTDLKEWRDFFPRAAARGAAGPGGTGEAHPADDVVPLIVVDDVPLKHAITHLARQVGCEVEFDPEAMNVVREGVPLGDMGISVRFENVTARDTLLAVLDNYGLAMVRTPSAEKFNITRAVAPAPIWPEEALEFSQLALAPGADERMPTFAMEGVSGIEALRTVAQQARFNFQFAPEITRLSHPTNYSLRLTQVTLREVLERVITDHGLALGSPNRAGIPQLVQAGSAVPVTKPKAAAAVLESFAPFEDDFRVLHAACGRPRSRMNVDYRRVFREPPPRLNFTGYRQVAQALALHASAHLALSNSPAALRDVTALFRMAESLRDQPNLTAVVIQVSVSGLSLNVIWEGLAGRRWSPGEMTTLDAQLRSLDLLAACATGWEGEQAMRNWWLEHTPQAELGEDFVEAVTCYTLLRKPKPASSGAVGQVFRLCPQGWMRQLQIAYTENFQDHLSLLDVQRQRVFPAAIVPSAFWLKHPVNSAAPLAALARNSTLNFVRPEQVCAREQTGINLARVACALERYRLAQGHFPDDLAELQPQFLEGLPQDLVNGHALEYRRTDDGLSVLYSVGWNGKDDAAAAGDWVWRYPSAAHRVVP